MRDEAKKNTLLLGRADWHFRANALVIGYLLAAVISGFFRKGINAGTPAWLTVHLLLLGAVTNAIVTWSDHFVSSLLWARSQNRTRQMSVITLLNVGIIGVLFSVSARIHWLVFLTASLVGGVIIYYLYGMTSLMKKALNKKFKNVIAYYQCAGLMILIGIVLGAIDATKDDKDAWQPRIALAHLHANLLGWVDLTIIGTLVTLWPTVLRTQMRDDAIAKAKLGLKFLLTGILLCIFGSLSNQPLILAIGLIAYLFGAVIALLPSALLLRRRLPDRSSSWMLFTGATGLAVLLVGDIYLSILKHDSEGILTGIESHLLLVFTLWLLPILLGALTYLLPVVLGRGPVQNRKLESILNFGWYWRIFLLPISSLLQILPNKFHMMGQIVAAVAVGLFLALTLLAMRKSRVVTTSL